jgi:ATP phosphoribosyltransferase
VDRVLDFSAFLIANRDSWESRDMGQLLSSLGEKKCSRKQTLSMPQTSETELVAGKIYRRAENVIRFALPDGHQQPPTNDLLKAAGIEVEKYKSSGGNRRPISDLRGVAFKVIRPQDMPLQVANGNFDLAITGKDWLRNHLYQFPSSPVTELLDLKFGWVRIVAVVSNDLAVDDIASLRRYNAERLSPLRIASEYTNIADKYARDNHLGMYRIIPTWGATETFIPDDADLLIENTQTGKTLARHNLKIVDTLFESTACLIGNVNVRSNKSKQARLDKIINKMSRSLT